MTQIPRLLSLNWSGTPSASAAFTCTPSAMPAGTSQDLWNSYKDTLHTKLFRVTLDRLKHGCGRSTRITKRRRK